MDEIEKTLWKERERLSLSLNTRFLAEPIPLDNNLAQLCLQSTKIKLIEENDNDVYIIWLTNEDNKEDELLNGIDIKIFDSNNTLIDFISELQTSNVFLIIDHALVSNILTFLDDFSQIVFIYILKDEESDNTLIITDSTRTIRKISNNKDELFRSIIEDIDTCTKDLICNTIFDLSTIEESTNQTKNTSFIWYYLLIESLFDITISHEKAKNDLIEYCRQQYPTDSSQQNIITKFENEYSSENGICWYTRDTFIYRQLNKALRIRDIDVIFKFRFFIIDFQKQLEQHYDEQMNQSLQIVYRGQQISQLELNKLKNSLGKYISFNTYLSATLYKNIAETFAGQTTMSVIFEIDADSAAHLKNKRARPVYVQDKSYFPEEFEVIFPIGSSFLLDSIWIEDHRWHIKLKLTDNNDYNQMIDLIQTMYMNNVPSKVKFASLLVSSGDYDKAERYIQTLIEDSELSSDNVNLGYAYTHLGQIWSERGDYQCALPYFEKALNNIQSENVYRATIYRYVGDLYCNTTEYDIALTYLHQALAYEHEMKPLELAELYEAFGNVYRGMKNFDNALTYVNQALTIRQSNLSSDDMLGFTYAYLAFIYQAKSDYTEALQFYKRALNILLKTLPKNHPFFIYIYGIIGNMHTVGEDTSLAMIYSQKALDLMKIVEQKETLNPTTHIFICNVLVDLYETKQDAKNVFYYAQEAYDIYKQFKSVIPDNYAGIRSLHTNLSRAYYNLCDFTSALSILFEAVYLCKSIDNQALILDKIGKIYFKQGYIDISLRYFNEALELNLNTNQSIVNSNTLSSINYSMSDIYKLQNNLEKSIFFAKEALRLKSEQTDKSSGNATDCYLQLIDLCPEMKKEYIEEILKIVQKHDLSTFSKIYSHNMVAFYHLKENDLTDALYHFKLSLKYQLTCIPPRYIDLIFTYSNIASVYKTTKGEDSDTALFYLEKGRDIYLELLNKQEIPAKDRYGTLIFEGYSLENINQSSYLIVAVYLTYSSIANCYIKKENYEKALNHLHTIEQILSEYNGKKQIMIQDAIYCYIGYLYELMKDYDKAIFLYEKRLIYISNDYNKYGSTFYLIARVYGNKKDYFMAISKYKISLTFYHNSQPIDYTMLAKCYKSVSFSYRRIKNDEYALIFFEQALEYYLLCNPINYDDIISAYLENVNVIYSLKPWDYKEPLKYLLSAIKFSQYDLKDDSLKDLYSNLGIYCFMNRKHKTSLVYYDKLVKYYKESDSILDVYKIQCVNYALIGQYDEALDIIKKVINIRFNSETLDFVAISGLYSSMGFMYYQIGKYKLALKYYKFVFNILEIYQNNRKHENYSDIYVNIAYSYFEYGQITDALQFCLKARNIHLLNENNRHITINIYVTLALIECKLENYYNALDYFGKAWEFIFNENLPYLDTHRILYNHIGYVYYKLGQIDIAMDNYFKSLSLYNDCQKHPDLAELYKNIGLICEQNEKTYTLALLFYKRALQTLPDNKYPHHILYKSMIITLELKLKKKES